MPGQLVFPFGVRPVFDREEFIVAPCNEQAFRFIERWPDWPVRAAALYGPAGCGKTHLARIWLEASGATEQALSDLASGPSDRAVTLLEDFEQAISSLPPEAPVLIEDLDRKAPTVDRDRLLMALFERPATRLLLTGRGLPSEWPVVIGDLRTRFDSLLAFAMWAPDDALLSGLVRKHFADRQLAVPENVVRRILTHVERSPQAVAAFVGRADARAWSEKRAVSEKLVTELIEDEERGRAG